MRRHLAATAGSGLPLIPALALVFACCDGRPAAEPAVAEHAEPAHDHAAHEGAAAKPDPGPCADTPLEELVASLKSGDEGVRENAARLIGARKNEARGALDALVATFGDAEPNVRMAAVQAVGAMGAEGAPAIEPLVALFDDPQSFTGDCGCVAFPVRIEAARALARIGDAALPAVLAQAKHEQAHRREAAVVALAATRRADPRIVETLTAALKDGERRVRDKAREALLDIERAKAAAPAAP
jgi:HEAT repeat protein